MRLACSLLLLASLFAGVAARGDEPKVVARPDAFPTLVNPACSHCVDEAKRRAGELHEDDPVLCWTRGYSDGGAIPIRFFLSKYRVISDSYGLFVYDPDAGFARGFAPSYNFVFHGWRNGVMVIKDTKDGTLYSALSGRGIEGPRKGERLKPVPTLVSKWGWWLEHYPHAVAYQMPAKYQSVPLPKEPNAESVKTRLAKIDPRLKPDEEVLGLRVGNKAIAYPLADWAKSQWYAEYLTDKVDGEKIIVMWQTATKTATAYKSVAHQPRKYKAPNPDKDGISPPDGGQPLPPGATAAGPTPVDLEIRGLKGGTVLVTKGGTNGDSWDIAGRC
ncbi:MAG TPA: DUF3179 domain-containing (seleno)protein, partial [Gemmata sp.]|nr:DUF3179 domain-containing (seleno)protein [Gemmata sp.]